jgi:hypothetical protein
MPFQITFQSETLTTMTVEKFLCAVLCVSSNWSAHWMPSHRPTHKALFTTLYHYMSHKVPSFSENSDMLHMCTVWILKWRLSVLWVIKRLLHTEQWWGRSLVCILECSVKVPFCVRCTHMYGRDRVSLQHVFWHDYFNSEMLWRPSHIHSIYANPLCATYYGDLNPACYWTFYHTNHDCTAAPPHGKYYVSQGCLSK